MTDSAPVYTTRKLSRPGAPVQWAVVTGGQVVRTFREPHAATRAVRWAADANAGDESTADKLRNRRA